MRNSSALLGFAIEKNNKRYLVINHHVVLGCAQDKNPTNVGGWICANKLGILHNRLNHLLEWIWIAEDLIDEHNNRRWLEHPTLGAGADVVALPRKHMEDVKFYALDVGLSKTDIVVGPADSVSIVGFPYGIAQQGGLRVWKTGKVASDLDINIAGKAIFLVDTTSRPGMSGSPVYAVRDGSLRTGPGRDCQPPVAFHGSRNTDHHALPGGLATRHSSLVTASERTHVAD